MAGGHFFASSLAEWRVGTDLVKLVNTMKAGGFNFSLFWVPLPEDAEYEIREFTPVVDGVALLSQFTVNPNLKKLDK